MMSKTKIVATIGPACDSKAKIVELIKAGVSTFRFNFKHADLNWHDLRMKKIRTIAEELKLPVGIMVDIEGPELRLGKLKKGKLEIKKGEIVSLGPDQEIVFDNLSVLQEIKNGQRILLDDGRIELRVESKNGYSVKALALTSGIICSNKGINLPETEIVSPTLSENDLKGIKLAKKYEADFIALSFVRDEEDVKNLRRVLEKEGLAAMIIAKIENRSAIENFEKILFETDGIMVARGDLGVELPLEEVPFWQKYIIKRCLRVSKPVITATEMLSSMVGNSRPTRAEVSDIANSVYDRSDALMLSGETAIGKYPLEAVTVMRNTCQFIEGKLLPLDCDLPAYKQTNAIVLAAFDLVKQSDLPQPFKAFVVLTEKGKTVRILSSFRPELPILAITLKKTVQRQLTISFGVAPFYFNYRKSDVGGAIESTIRFLKNKGELEKGEKVVMIYGDDWCFPGRTNLVRIQRV